MRGHGGPDWDDYSRHQGEVNRSEMYFAWGISRSRRWIGCGGCREKAVARVMPRLSQAQATQGAGMIYQDRAQHTGKKEVKGYLLVGAQ